MQKYKEAILYVVIFVIVLIFLLVKLKPQAFRVYDLEKNIETKSAEIIDYQRKLDELKASEAQKTNLSGLNKTIYKPGEAGVDAEASFSVVFDDIIEMAKYNGIKIYSIEYVYNPTDDEFVKSASDQYNVCQLKMQVIADYPDLESFIKDLYKYPYLINIEKVELTPYAKNKKILISNVQLKLYSSKH